MRCYQAFLVVVSLTSILISSFFIFNTFSEAYVPPKDTSLKIGFVNIKKIFQDYKKTKEMEQKLNQEMEAELSSLKGLDEERKQLREEIPLYRPGSKIRIRKEQQLAEKIFEIKHKKDRAEYFSREKMRMGIEKVYEEMSDEIEQHAQQNNYFMIIRVSDADFFGTSSEEALRLQINTRDVLFWEKKNDITDAIIEQMNKKYEAAKNAPGKSESN